MTAENGIRWKARGTFFPESTFDLTPPTVVPPDVASLVENIPYSDKHVYGFVSDYTIDSLAQSFVKTSPYDFWIQNSDVPSASPFKLDTTDLTVFFPNLALHYGIGLPMSMKININEMKNFTSSAA